MHKAVENEANERLDTFCWKESQIWGENHAKIMPLFEGFDADLCMKTNVEKLSKLTKLSNNDFNDNVSS